MILEAKNEAWTPEVKDNARTLDIRMKDDETVNTK
jgi:hypothetical protein